MDFTSIIKKGIKKAKGLKTEPLNNTTGSALETATTLKENAVSKNKQAKKKLNTAENGVDKTYLRQSKPENYMKDRFSNEDLKRIADTNKKYAEDKDYRKNKVNKYIHADEIRNQKANIKESNKSIATAKELQSNVEKVAKPKKKK